MNQIRIPEKGKSQFFFITSVNRTVAGSKLSEFVQKKLVELSLIDVTESTLIFRYKLHHQVMEGSAMIHTWSADMEELQSDLVIITDMNGKFKDLDHFENLSQKWEGGFLEEVSPKYVNHKEVLEVMAEETSKLLGNKEQFLKTFVGYSSWRFFFQDWYRIHPTEEDRSLDLTQYFGKVDLPLNIHSVTEKEGEKGSPVVIKNTAVLDKEKFDRKTFARMLKDLTNVYNIDATLDVDLEERYEFAEDGWLTEAEMFLQTAVSNWYSISSAHQIKRLSEAEKKEFSEFTTRETMVS